MNRHARGEFLGIGAARATGFGAGDCELRGSDARFARARAGARLQEAGAVTPDLILAEDRRETDPEALQEIGIVRTVVGGRAMLMA